MNFNIHFKRNNYNEQFSEDEYEDATELFLILEEFKFLYVGYIKLDFGNDKILKIDYDFEFIVEHIAFLEILDYLNNEKIIKYTIWVCEQGADYYLNHEKKNDFITVSVVKGKNCGLDSNEFKATILIDEYKKEWEKLFKKLFSFITTKLPKHNDTIARLYPDF